MADVGYVRTAVEAAAGALDAESGEVTAVQTRLGSCHFAGATAGRLYSSQGVAVHAGVQALAEVVGAWSTGCTTAAGALRSSLALLDDTDAGTVDQLGGQTG